jgi:adenosine deaminase
MTPTTPRPLATLPKAHLHVHLEGAMRPSTLFELCEAQGTDVPTIGGRYGTFADFQELYITARRSIASLDDLVRLVGEVVADAADDGAVWIEPAVHVAGYRAFGSDDVILDALVDAGRRAAGATGIGVGWLVSVDRTLSPELAIEQATLAARYAGQGVVAMGLANDEAAAPPEPFGPAFAIARAAGIISAPHAGEHCGPESVRGALDALGADRIQHGVRVVEDPGLVDRLADEGVCLDVCPTSNVSLSVVSSLDAHPLPMLLEAGVSCSINADDPLLFGVGVLDEYVVCRERLGLDDTALASCARTSIDHSGAPDDVRVVARRAIDDWLRS